METYDPDPYKVIAVLVNPKTKELVEVVRAGDRSSVFLRYPGLLENIGKAYVDLNETYDIYGDTYVRSHSIGAGVEKGKGFGVVLYSGLCLFAYSDTRNAGIASSDGGGHSHSGRLTDADRFWERCVANGLAEETTIEGELEERTYEEYGSDKDMSCEYIPDEECSGVLNIAGEIIYYYEVEGPEVEAQYMPATLVAENNLIFAAPGMREELEFDPLSADILVTLNLQHCYDAGLAELIIEYAIDGGYDLAVVQRLAQSLPERVYERTSVSKQLKFDYVSNKAASRKLERDIDEVWEEVYGGLMDID